MTDHTPQKSESGLSLRTICLVAYGLFALGFLTSGVFALATIAAVIIVYIKRSDAAGTIYASHFDWLISTFLWSLLWMGLSLLGTFILIGWVGLLVTVIWVLYRLIRGFLLLLEAKPVAAIG